MLAGLLAVACSWPSAAAEPAARSKVTLAAPPAREAAPADISSGGGWRVRSRLSRVGNVHRDPAVSRVVFQQPAEPLEDEPALPERPALPRSNPLDLPAEDIGQPEPSELEMPQPPRRPLPLRPLPGEPETAPQPDPEVEPLPEDRPTDEDPFRLPPRRPVPGQNGENDLNGRLAVEIEQECENSIRQLREASLDRIALSIRVEGRAGRDYPHDCELPYTVFEPRAFSPTCFRWTATALCHKPLYFEEPELERYGHTWGPYLQPLVSAGHFYAVLPTLPYHMGMDPPWECEYPLGHYRPGNCAPWIIPAMPLSVRGGLVEAGVVTGLIFLIP